MTGGSSATGGTISSGGTKSEGGSESGGTTSAGGTTSPGGRSGTGGGRATGGRTSGTGGARDGGNPGEGGTTGGGGATGKGGSTGTSTDVTVQLDQTHQTIDGFGINDTWNTLTDSQAKELFDANTGIGLTILRVGMNPSGSFYNSNESSAISSAKKYGATKIIGSVWSPPANCKSNNSTQNGGHLNTSCHESWSTSIVNFAKNNGLYGMSPANEPDFASCGSTEPCNGNYDTTLYTAKEMVAFIKVVGPKLQAAGIKVIAPEASEWVHFWKNESGCCSEPGGKPSSDPLKCGCFTGKTTACASTCTEGNGYDYGHWLYKDKDAWAAIDIIGVHQYDTQVAEPWPADVNGGKPDKPLWQTEMSGVKWWPEQGPSTDIKNGVAVAGWLHNALTVGDVNAWLWWWIKAQGGTNEGLYNSDGADTKRHYTFGNFTKFIRPGYKRVEVSGKVPENVLLSAYSGTGTVVVVAINKGTASADVPITIAGGTAPASCTPTVTSASDNLKSGAAVTVSGGTFTAALPGTTVTTFVCK